MDESQLKTPAALGFSMPAEWNPHQATWLTWPKDPETWPDRVTHVEEIYLQMIGALTPHEIVNLLVDDEERFETESVLRPPRKFISITFKPSIRGFATTVQIFSLDQTARVRSTTGFLMPGEISTKS